MFKIKPEVVDILTEVLIKIIGDSIRGRLARTAFLISAVIGSQFIHLSTDTPECAPPINSNMHKIQSN
jgi:hypothetical protein